MAQSLLNGVLAASPASIRNVAPRGLGVRPTLPDRNVTGDTIEDAYVRFVLYCNPAVPLDTDTAALREAFKTPPKSGGKSFSTFTLFRLIKQLADKEIKTWGELALKLGVEPPDQDKGQSSQKIQQYAVRLKRWMHSMHVDAYFEYLLNNPHAYWTQIPSDPNPVSDILRDGVAAEDDMALRALLPQIRPRRGRRKPEDDDLNKSPSQRPRLASPARDAVHSLRPDSLDPWSAHPDGRPVFLFPQSDGRMGMGPPVGMPPGPPPWHIDMTQTPLTAYPQSAITPSTRQSFWDNEPKSAITPSKSRAPGRRHGAKVVSSAWRSGGPGGTGKTRGRPPLSRNVGDGPSSAFPTDTTQSFPLMSSEPCHMPSGVAPAAIPDLTPTMPPAVAPAMLSQPGSAPTSAGPRPPKPGRLSLQVPERIGGEVRLATPPPIVMLNGQVTPGEGGGTLEQQPPGECLDDIPRMDFPNSGNPPQPLSDMPPDENPAQPAVYFRDASDRTNMYDIESFLLYEIITGDWTDNEGNSIPAPGLPEAQAIITQVIDSLRKTATTKEGFLLNLAALGGGRLLMKTTSLRLTRLEETPECNRYRCDWELRFGDVVGAYSMKDVTIQNSTWKKPDEEKDSPPPPPAGQGANGTAGELASASYWQKKYAELLGVVDKLDREMISIKFRLMDGLKDPFRKPIVPADLAENGK